MLLAYHDSHPAFLPAEEGEEEEAALKQFEARIGSHLLLLQFLFFQDRLEKISFILVVIFFFSPSQIWDTMAVNAFWVHCSCYYWLGP